GETRSIAMQAQERALSSFIVVEAACPLDALRRLIIEIKPTHVVVHRGEASDDRYWLFAVDAFPAPPTAHAVIADALALEDKNAVPLIAAGADAAAMPDRCIIHVDRCIIGFFEAGYVPTRAATDVPRRTTRGATLRRGAAPEPALITR